MLAPSKEYEPERHDEEQVDVAPVVEEKKPPEHAMHDVAVLLET
jgi:hypothetical protein